MWGLRTSPARLPVGERGRSTRCWSCAAIAFCAGAITPRSMRKASGGALYRVAGRLQPPAPECARREWRAVRRPCCNMSYTEYVAHVARLNAATLATLASAPPSPAEAKVVTSNLDNNTTLRWQPGPGTPAGTHYQIVWRELAATDWQYQAEAAQFGSDGSATLPVSKDNVIFGITGGGCCRACESRGGSLSGAVGRGTGLRWPGRAPGYHGGLELAYAAADSPGGGSGTMKPQLIASTALMPRLCRRSPCAACAECRPGEPGCNAGSSCASEWYRHHFGPRHVERPAQLSQPRLALV